jgi:Na+-driven multidrug efflux pump
MALVATAWTVVGLAVTAAAPFLLGVVGTEPAVAAQATRYVTVRMAGLAVTLVSAALVVALRVVGEKRRSLWLAAVGLGLNALLDAAILYSPARVLVDSPVLAVAITSVATQVVITAVGLRLIWRRLSAASAAPGPPRAGVSQLSVARSLLVLGSGVGLRQMNDYAASVVPFILVSRLDAPTIAAATVATKIWTLYCRVPQAIIGTAGVFIGYARGRTPGEARAVARRVVAYVVGPSLIAAVACALAVPALRALLGGNQVSLSVVWVLSGAYLVAVPAYLIEQFCSEILTVEQRAAWLSVPSTMVTYLVAIPMAAVGVLVWRSALIAVLSAAVASALLGAFFFRRTRQLGYRLVGKRSPA